MSADQESSPAIIRLTYEPDELILKQGNYACSLYRLVTGEVRLLARVGGQPLEVARVDPGQVIGEEVLVNTGSQPLSTSAQAQVVSELEVWPRARLVGEINKLPPLFRGILTGGLGRLHKTRSAGLKLREKIAARKTAAETQPSQHQAENRRQYYRKKVDLACRFHFDDQGRKSQPGRLRDISQQGALLEVGGMALAQGPYEIGRILNLELTLPSGQDLTFQARIVSQRKGAAMGTRTLGLNITDISTEDNKRLGFFLMP